MVARAVKNTGDVPNDFLEDVAIRGALYGKDKIIMLKNRGPGPLVLQVQASLQAGF